MAFVIERAVVKGLVGSIIETRNIFTCEIDYDALDDREGVWLWYINGVFDPVTDMFSSLFTITEVEIFTWNISEWQTVDSFSYTFTGNGGGDSYNSMIAAVMIGKALGLRRLGRKFLGPLAEAAISGNTLVSGAVAMMASALIAYVSSFVTTNGSVVVPGIMDKGNVFRPFIGGVVSPLLGTCRRRKQAQGI